jgi:hypothetical protein
MSVTQHTVILRYSVGNNKPAIPPPNHNIVVALQQLCFILNIPVSKQPILVKSE